MRKARIIIFDDDPVILDMLDYYFSVRDFEVQSFSEPVLCHTSESTNSCLTPCADIIITDFRMPQRNGFDLLHYQAQRGCNISIWNKAIVSGALPSEHLLKTYEVAGMFFEKPFSLTELRAWTKECMARVDLTRPLSSYNCRNGKYPTQRK